MAKPAKGIAYANMTEEQKKLAQKISRRYGIPVEKVSITKKTGMAIINREDCPHLSDVDYNIVREGLHWDEITDAHREEYLEELERDRISAEDLEAAKAGLASMRS